MQKNAIKLLLILSLTLCISCTYNRQNVPDYMDGTFQDDYNIEFEITKKLFFQKPNARFYILKWNMEEQYFIAKNDSLNPYDPSLYSRIDWMKFENMLPYEWGFCLSVYDAISADSAEVVNVVDRSKPKTGCNGYPFSRMKPILK